MPKKTAAQLDHEIREFLAGSSRTFMRPEVTAKQLWACIATIAGDWWVPVDVLTATEVAAAKRGDFEPLRKYTEASRVDSEQSKLMQGYGVRLQAPGYMDATEWEVFPSKLRALERALELAQEYEGDEDW